MGNTPSTFSACGSACPVENVNWWDAIAYCNARSQAEALTPCYSVSGCTGTPGDGSYACTGVTFAGVACGGYRLPTEAEWEYAARAGTPQSTYNGTTSNLYPNCQEPNPFLDPIAWFKGNSCTTAPATTCTGGAGCTPHPVGLLRANPWGLSDVLGNVGEWVWDVYGRYPSTTATDPTGPTTGTTRVIRGGGWASPSSAVRASARTYVTPATRGNSTGFRPAIIAAP
jgi:formylglycine-generating enzyme required for sulfatase activity